MKCFHWLTSFALLFTCFTMAAAEAPKAGDKAPAFEAKDQDGKTIKLTDYTGKQAVLLYFYPKDQTPGCTKQACGFRDQIENLKSQNVVVLGVSMDNEESHRKFIAKEKLNFSLLADTEGKMTDLFGSRMAGRNLSRRISFLIDKSGTITHVTDSPSADTHLSEMKAAVAKLK